jgi:HAD superfamily hydrolase (TIGR01490 family)
MQRIAVFDIDGTIFRSSLIIELLYELVECKIFPKSCLKLIDKDFFAWLNREGHYEDYINKVVEVYRENIKGKKVKDFEETEQRVITKHKGKVYRYTRSLMQSLKNKDYIVLAISGSPIGVVGKFSKSFGFDYWIGTEYEVSNKKYTGKVINDPFFDGKDKALLKFIKDKKLHIDLEHSIAIGDAWGDIPLLEAVGNPIAFNPSMDLAKIAKKKGWRVVVERKDVIYEISNFKFLKID